MFSIVVLFASLISIMMFLYYILGKLKVFAKIGAFVINIPAIFKEETKNEDEKEIK
ncbi:hypothetical protein P4597_27455 [Peribacillus simplex]|uniref:hypothetical protein n=1 Tax=Peribacillus simplex TaxID=1478 RepID=UPI002E1F5B7C|nr:hypothetical protein [Peribacillus simplex]